LLLVFTYFFCGDNPADKSGEIGTTDEMTMEGSIGTDSLPSEEHVSPPVDESTVKEEPEPVVPQPTEKEVDNSVDDGVLTCTITISCNTILDNMNSLDEAKHPLIPSDGIILEKKEVTFNEGESVFDVLLRETRNSKIHMEYVKTPVYDSAYIEGIHNLYEFDCGELSGWMYSVNGWFPNYGCSNYILNNGDNIEWVYTCNLGKDVK